MKTIIVATDFSPASTCAMNYAADLAVQLKAKLALVHVYQVPIAVSDTPLVLASVDEMKENAEQRMAETKRGIEHVLSGAVPVEAACRLGDTIDEIASYCETVIPFAVIMGTAGHTGLETTLFGSTTLSAIRHLKWPVLAVPVGKEYGTGIARIAVTGDFREAGDSPANIIIKDVVKQFDAKLYLLDIHHADAEKIDPIKTAFAEFNPDYHSIDNKMGEQGISDFAEQQNLDLIVTTTKKHSLVDGLFHKDSTKKLVFGSRIPVLCIPEIG